LTYAEKLRAYSNWMSGVTLVCIAIGGCWNTVVSVLMFCLFFFQVMCATLSFGMGIDKKGMM
jgi:hypothetical protein